jgi:hypothetical protein
LSIWWWLVVVEVDELLILVEGVLEVVVLEVCLLAMQALL